MSSLKEKRINNQNALDYITYMMVTSYFKKASCLSSMNENRLHLSYKEMRSDIQDQMEKLCIRFAEKELLEKLPENIWNGEVKVKLFNSKKSGHTEIQIFGNGWILQINAQFKDNKTQTFAYRLTYKKHKKLSTGICHYTDSVAA